MVPRELLHVPRSDRPFLFLIYMPVQIRRMEQAMSSIDLAEEKLLEKLSETPMKLVEAISYVQNQTAGKNFGVELDIVDVLRRYISLGIVKYNEAEDTFYVEKVKRGD